MFAVDGFSWITHATNTPQPPHDVLSPISNCTELRHQQIRKENHAEAWPDHQTEWAPYQNVLFHIQTKSLTLNKINYAKPTVRNVHALVQPTKEETNSAKRNISLDNRRQVTPRIGEAIEKCTKIHENKRWFFFSIGDDWRENGHRIVNVRNTYYDRRWERREIINKYFALTESSSLVLASVQINAHFAWTDTSTVTLRHFYVSKASYTA